MDWEQLLAWVSGKVNESLCLKVEYLAAENRILRDQITGRPRLPSPNMSSIITFMSDRTRVKTICCCSDSTHPTRTRVMARFSAGNDWEVC